jgi:hypothetical protein
MAQIWTAGSPLFAIDPDMLAVMTMLPAIPRRFICCATAWMVKNVPDRSNGDTMSVLEADKTKKSRDLTRNVDVHHFTELFHRVFERGDHLLNPSRTKEPGDLDLALVIDLPNDSLNSGLVGDIQLSVGNAPSHLLGSSESHLPFSFERGVEDVQAVDLRSVGFKEGGRYA